MLQIPIMQKPYSAFSDLIFLGVLKAELLKYNFHSCYLFTLIYSRFTLIYKWPLYRFNKPKGIFIFHKTCFTNVSTSLTNLA